MVVVLRRGDDGTGGYPAGPQVISLVTLVTILGLVHEATDLVALAWPAVAATAAVWRGSKTSSWRTRSLGEWLAWVVAAGLLVPLVHVHHLDHLSPEGSTLVDRGAMSVALVACLVIGARWAGRKAQPVR
jgi:hypothetical protein